jgi:hypothetical protein
MASGLQPLLNVPGRVTSGNALKVKGDAGPVAGSSLSSLGSLIGTAAAGSDGLPVLLVVFTS